MDIALKLRERAKPASSSKPHGCFSKEILVQCWGKNRSISNERTVRKYKKKMHEMVEHGNVAL